jgi:hypothetical protein
VIGTANPDDWWSASLSLVSDPRWTHVVTSGPWAGLMACPQAEGDSTLSIHHQRDWCAAARPSRRDRPMARPQRVGSTHRCDRCVRVCGRAGSVQRLRAQDDMEDKLGEPGVAILPAGLSGLRTMQHLRQRLLAPLMTAASTSTAAHAARVATGFSTSSSDTPSLAPTFTPARVHCPFFGGPFSSPTPKHTTSLGAVVTEPKMHPTGPHLLPSPVRPTRDLFQTPLTCAVDWLQVVRTTPPRGRGSGSRAGKK